MNVVFEQLWNANIAPYKTCGRADPELAALADLVERNKAALDCELSENQKKSLHNFMVCFDEYRYLFAVHAFREGFVLASKLLSDVLAEGNRNDA